MAMVAPRTTLALASSRLADTTNPGERSVLLRAIGNAHRELANAADSDLSLSQARIEAVASGDERLIALADLSWAATKSYSGSSADSVILCQHAIDVLAGTPDEAIAWHQLAGVLGRQGKFVEAIEAAQEALARVDADNLALAAEINQNAGLALAFLGRYTEAIQRTESALAEFKTAGWDKRVADVTHNLGWLAVRQGEIGRAHQLLNEAERLYATGVERDIDAALWVDRAEASALAGLWDEAYDMLGRQISELDAAGSVIDAADGRLQRAKVALRIGRFAQAEEDATEAANIFGDPGIGNTSGRAAALITKVRARRGLGHVTPTDAHELAVTLDRLDGSAPADWRDGHLLLADLAVDQGNIRAARAHLDVLAQPSVNALDTVAVAGVQARLERVAGRHGAALEACRAGIGALAQLRSTTGALDLQAHVGAHAADLTDEGLRVALASGDPRLAFEWVEWRRGVSLAVPPARRERDEALVRDAARLRELDGSNASGSAEATVLARQVSQRARQIGGTSWVVDPPDIGQLGDALGDRTFVHLFTIDGGTWALVTGAAGSELVTLGSDFELRREARFLSAAVRRALQRPVTTDVVDQLRSEAGRLEVHLSPLTGRWGTDVIVCPPPDLASITWGLLPGLANTTLVIAPTARVLGRRAPDRSGVVLVAGPDLRYADAEITELCQLYPDAAVLAGNDANAPAVLEAMDGAELVHFSCHGAFNALNPMFSSLRLVDGPLYGYDLAGVARAPAIVSMASCHAAESRGVGVEDPLGLSTVLLASGTVAVLGARPAVPDSPDTVAVSVAVHEALSNGRSLAEALRSARARMPLVGAAFDVVGDDVTLSAPASPKF